MKKKISIIGIGSYIPKTCCLNDELSLKLNIKPEWIEKKTGIKTRYFAMPDQSASDLALEASKLAIKSSGIFAKDIDLIIVSTSTPDMIFPSTACLLQKKLDIKNIPAFDLSASCSGFLYALNMGFGFIQAGFGKNVLIASTEIRSRFTDYTDKDTAILYGDGSGAVILSSNKDGIGKILNCKLGACGSKSDILQIPGGGSSYPASSFTIKEKMHFVKIKKIPLMKTAISQMTKIIFEQIEILKAENKKINMIIPHQMNANIISSIAKKLKISLDKFYINVDKFGNTSSASIPIAFDEAIRNGTVSKNDLVLLVSFGGGITWGTCLIKL